MWFLRLFLVSVVCRCMCVCVVFPFILDVRLADVPAGVIKEKGRAWFLIHLSSAVLALIFSREGFSRCFPLVHREVEFLCTKELIDLHLLGIFYYYYIFFVRKYPSSCDCTGIRTHVPTSEDFEVTNWTTGATVFGKRENASITASRFQPFIRLVRSTLLARLKITWWKMYGRGEPWRYFGEIISDHSIARMATLKCRWWDWLINTPGQSTVRNNKWSTNKTTKICNISADSQDNLKAHHVHNMMSRVV